MSTSTISDVRQVGELVIHGVYLTEIEPNVHRARHQPNHTQSRGNQQEDFPLVPIQLGLGGVAHDDDKGCLLVGIPSAARN